jgi:hypothetical protein
VAIYKITDSEIYCIKKALVFFLEIFLVKDLDNNNAIYYQLGITWIILIILMEISSLKQA